MLDSFDYKEPRCATCGGKEFYSPNGDAPIERIPVSRIIEKVDKCFDKNDLNEAKRLLEYWQREAVELKDEQGELSILSELTGLYRKTLEKDKAIAVIERALALCEKLNNEQTVSGATVLLNCATTLNAFGLSKDSVAIYEKVEKTYELKLKKDDRTFGGFYNNYALAFANLGEYDKALDLNKKAIAVMEKLPNSQLELAITYSNMASLYEELGNESLLQDCLNKTVNFLKDETVRQDGYYAFVCEKCLPIVKRYGYGEKVKIIEERVAKIYARA